MCVVSNGDGGSDHRNELALSIGVALMSLALVGAPAFAMDDMKKDTMSKDGMAKDSMKKETMSKDSMKK